MRSLASGMEKDRWRLSPAGHDQPQCLLGEPVGQLPDQVLSVLGDEAVHPGGVVLVELVQLLGDGWRSRQRVSPVRCGRRLRHPGGPVWGGGGMVSWSRLASAVLPRGGTVGCLIAPEMVLAPLRLGH